MLPKAKQRIHGSFPKSYPTIRKGAQKRMSSPSGSSLEKAIGAAQSLNGQQEVQLSREAAVAKSQALVDSCGIAMLGSTDANGYPNIKAMMKVETEGIKTIWFSTNTSSKRISQFKENPKACVYFHNEPNFQGLLLVGEIEILNDSHSRRRLWKEGWEVYYPLGIDDPDYSVLRFTAKWANYYEGLRNVSFDI